MKKYGKQSVFCLLLALIMLLSACGSSQTKAPASEPVTNTANTGEASGTTAKYPAGPIVWWATGQPEFRKTYYDDWFARHQDIAAGCYIEPTTIKTTNEGQQQVAMYKMSGDYASMPDIMFLDAVGVVNMGMNGLLRDETDFYATVADDMVDGAANDATINGRVYGLPDAVRPQMMFYNAEIFEKYGIDPAEMKTFDGYLEVGRKLKEASNGTVYLSYIDPGTYTWRYWGRRGLMPQANARIWDEQGNVVIGEDPGTKLALGFLDQLNSEGLLYKTEMMKQPLYEAADEGKIATFYIGAFWDEFLRGNLTATAGKWRAQSAPVFTQVGTAGAPVSTYYCVIEKEDDTYYSLLETVWKDFATDGEAYKTWVDKMVEQNGPYNNPVSKTMLADPYWQEGSDFYGGMSFRKAESDALDNPSKNLTVTPNDAEADNVISAEIEKYVAGEQTMEDAIRNMDKELKARIGQAKMP